MNLLSRRENEGEGRGIGRTGRCLKELECEVLKTKEYLHEMVEDMKITEVELKEIELDIMKKDLATKKKELAVKKREDELAKKEKKIKLKEEEIQNEQFNSLVGDDSAVDESFYEFA